LGGKFAGDFGKAKEDKRKVTLWSAATCRRFLDTECDHNAHAKILI